MGKRYFRRQRRNSMGHQIRQIQKQVDYLVGRRKMDDIERLARVKRQINVRLPPRRRGIF